MEERPRIAFWLHQAIEYVLGLLLFLTAIRLVGPLMVYALVGGLLFVALAAISRGPLAAFHWLGRSAHRAVDIVLALFLAASPLLLRFDNVGMVILAEGIALALATLVRRTAYVDPPRPPRPPIGEAIGRTIDLDRVTRAATDGARVAGNLLGKAPRNLGRVVGRHKRPR